MLFRSTVGLPVEILPLLLTVDWILSRARAATNVVSDILVALLLDKLASPPPDRRRGVPVVPVEPAASVGSVVS